MTIMERRRLDFEGAARRRRERLRRMQEMQERGFSYAKIAEVMSLHESTVRTILNAEED